MAYQDEEACRTLDKLIRDPLTGLYNYQYFMRCLEAETLRADRFFQPLSLIMIDIDNFEVFNNQFGREEGDALIKEVGALFRKNFRDTDIVCRQSQDQFLVILPETKKEEALSVAKAVKDVIQESSFQTSVTCSMGLSRYISGMTTQELLLKANLGLYMAKEMGRNEACLYG
jgi:diguanylate cyclase (GGDEF)-like protein